ncbi:MAG: hypothetical protein R5N75_10185 [Cutibacterium granulosum]|uniref:hypothetical protein n=1 Tax=Cutibacterium granulosum TaxID=33011 RepID=UPI002B223F81|nr:hypothetical protein [Cutibacterium granulosum]MEA5660462.1 hypothetical protein [Cutibacterium granulosum]
MTNTTYASRAAAIEREIVAPIEAGDVTQARLEFDIDAIADEVLGDHEQGYACMVDEERFWQIVAAHHVDRDLTLALADLHTHRDICLLRSVVTLFDLDITDRRDTGAIDARMSELKRESDEVQACFVAETTHFLQDKEVGKDNINVSEYLDRACERVSDIRMDYLSSEWKLAKEQLKDIDDVYMWGTPKLDPGEWTDDDLAARWIDLSDDEGTTYAQVCVSMESEGLGNDTYRSSLDTGACFAIRGFNVVDDEDHEGFTSPIDENVALNIENQTEAFSFVRDTGVLCEAIVNAVQWLIEAHEEQVRLDRERREREADNDDKDEEEDEEDD